METKKQVHRPVTQADIDRNEAVRMDGLKVGDMAWFDEEARPGMSKERFFALYAGIGITAKCVAKSFKIPDRILNGVLLNDNQEPVLYLTKNGFSDFYSIDEWVLSLRSIDQLTDDEITKLMNSIGLMWPEIDSKDSESILIVDDSYSVGLFFDGTVVMYKGHGLHRKPYWNDIKRIYDGLISIGICLDNEAIKKGWVVTRKD
jgi:hypothetical protein